MASYSYIAIAVATLHYDGNRKSLISLPTEVRIVSESADMDDAWCEFVECALLDAVRFPGGAELFLDEVIEENWEYVSIRSEAEHSGQGSSKPKHPPKEGSSATKKSAKSSQSGASKRAVVKQKSAKGSAALKKASKKKTAKRAPRTR